MISVEPSWEAVGDVVAEEILQSDIPFHIKGDVVTIVLHIASIAHHARVHHFQEQLRNGELSPDEVPIWALENLGDDF
jgi:hypothetical protein